MGEYDATQVWDYEMSSHDYLEESYTCRQEDTWDLDDDYGRDSTDWQQMAYIHFAWELVRVSHYTIVFHTFGKIVWQFNIGILYYYSQQDPLLRTPAVILKKLSRPWTVSELSFFYGIRAVLVYDTCMDKFNYSFTSDEDQALLDMIQFFDDVGLPDHMDQKSYDSLCSKFFSNLWVV